ncbi:lactococcin 972 family bacteriocin [Streptomyces sp. NPDC048518]|uniref:lactococcin 972 family bacteriocin n=1 Tax=Streptomyces sp. NPDC048518 TaxID=3155029 RepID=UPI0033FEB923
MAAATGVLASPASADPVPQSQEWGMATVKIDPNSDEVTPTTVKEVGGGTWSYGTVLTTGGKRCYSNYYHGSKGHTATAILANGTDKDHAAKGKWAKASVEAGAAYTCHVYWGKD